MDGDDRRRALVEAGIAITSELSLDAVLQTLIRIAAELTDARDIVIVRCRRNDRSISGDQDGLAGARIPKIAMN